MSWDQSAAQVNVPLDKPDAVSQKESSQDSLHQGNTVVQSPSSDVFEQLKRLGETLSVQNSKHTILLEFHELNLKDSLARGIAASGYEKPSIIQARALKPAILDKRDIFAQAHSGTGKTLSYAITVLQNIDENETSCQALVLVPSRELARQIGDVFKRISSKMNVIVTAFIGGVQVATDVTLASRTHIAVGTPGRIKDLINRNSFKLNLKVFVLDEVDKMLSGDFLPQVYEIYQCVPKAAQIFLCSATKNESTTELISTMLNDPVEITVKVEEVNLHGIAQYYAEFTQKEDKFHAIVDLLSAMNYNQMIIFTNSQIMADALSKHLTENGHDNLLTHGQLTMENRIKALEQFVQCRQRILITTDMLCRGIDVQQVDVVVNFEIPRNFEDYVHRIGRCGRFGKSGVAINFLSPEEKDVHTAIQDYYKITVNECPPEVETIVGRK